MDILVYQDYDCARRNTDNYIAHVKTVEDLKKHVDSKFFKEKAKYRTLISDDFPFRIDVYKFTKGGIENIVTPTGIDIKITFDSLDWIECHITGAYNSKILCQGEGCIQNR